MRSLMRPGKPADEVTDDPAATAFVEPPAKWESEKSPEALYERVNDVATQFAERKYSRAMAAQRLLDLIYDIDAQTDGSFPAQAKSRYYLLLFNYIYRIRSARRGIADIVLRRSLATDQTAYISGVDFSNLSLPGMRIGNTLFSNCNFADSVLQGNGISSCQFRGCDFSRSSLQGLAASSCQFIQCRLEGVDLTDSEIFNSTFEGVTLARGNLSSGRIVKSSFVGCDFSEIISSRGQRPLRVNGCTLIACSFREADLRGADFRKSRMTGCDTLDAQKQDARGLA